MASQGMEPTPSSHPQNRKLEVSMQVKNIKRAAFVLGAILLSPMVAVTAMAARDSSAFRLLQAIVGIVAEILVLLAGDGKCVARSNYGHRNAPIIHLSSNHSRPRPERSTPYQRVAYAPGLADVEDSRVEEEAYYEFKAPEFKVKGTQPINFVGLGNFSKNTWTFGVASQDKNEKNQAESGTIQVFKKTGNRKYPIEFIAELGPGDTCKLVPDGVYLFYPAFEGKLGGMKALAKDFARTVYLEDANQKKVGFNFTRSTASGAKAEFGYTAGSVPTRDEAMKNPPVQMDATYPDYLAIESDTILYPSAKPF